MNIDQTNLSAGLNVHISFPFRVWLLKIMRHFFLWCNYEIFHWKGLLIVESSTGNATLWLFQSSLRLPFVRPHLMAWYFLSTDTADRGDYFVTLSSWVTSWGGKEMLHTEAGSQSLLWESSSCLSEQNQEARWKWSTEGRELSATALSLMGNRVINSAD